jgi:hypothetical protein
MKVVINACFGGFGLSEAAVCRYCEIKGLKLWVVPNGSRFASLTGPIYSLVPPKERIGDMGGKWRDMTQEERVAHNKKWSEQTLYDRDLHRDDPALVQTVEELGEKANGRHASLTVVEIPDGVEWEIDEYDGTEHVAEKHRTWR